MYELTIERTFSAAHAIEINGEMEPLHGHDWGVRLCVTGDELDDNGLLCDFHALEKKLDDVLAPFVNQNLNETSPFDATNPTAEHVARYIADSMGAVLPKGLRLVSLSVDEAPGCTATWRAD